MIIPIRAAAVAPAARPIKKLPLKLAAANPTYAPNIYKAPWARLTTRINPIVRDSPAPNRNRIDPNDIPNREIEIKVSIKRLVP